VNVDEFPCGLLCAEPLTAEARERVEPGAAVGLGIFPFGAEPALFFEAMESRIERAVFNLENVERVGADGLADAVAVLGAPLESAQDEEVEGALQDVEFVHVVGSLPL